MDIQYLLFLQQFREATNGFLTEFFTFITNIAVDFYILVPAFVIFWTISKRKGSMLLCSISLGYFMNMSLKSLFCVYRPWIRSSEVMPVKSVLEGAGGYSFPSGHSTSVGAFYGTLIGFFRKHKGLCVFCAFMILVTMFSRNYVGVHTPQDVIVGCLLGILAAVIVSYVSKYLQKNPKKDLVVLLVVTVICIGLLIFVTMKSYPMDYVDGKLLVSPKSMTASAYKYFGLCYGIILAWFIERRFIKFDITGTKYQKLSRALIGSLLAIFWISAVIGPLGKALDNGAAYFALRMTTPLLFMCLYPIIFKAIEKRQKSKVVAKSTNKKVSAANASTKKVSAKASSKKTTTKTSSKKPVAKKTTVKKAPAKASSKKTSTGKTTTRKTAAKTTTKKAGARKTATKAR